MDNLTYAYSGNRLNSVSDAISTNNEVDFVPRGNNAYTYYANGALKSDANEQIANILYNTYLNQPNEVFLTDGRKIKHHYDGSGTLFKTEYFNSSGTVFETYHYIDGLIYKNGAFFQIGIPEGRVIFSNGNWQYEFDYKDHLGNTRASFKAENNVLVQTAKSDFDPFGVILKSSQSNTFANRFELQGKERDLTFGLNWVNFGARRMNPTIGRMDNIDAMASKFASHSLYNYTLNSPLVIIDPDGNESRDIWGNTTFQGFVGDDGSGNFVGSIGGGGDDKEKGKKKEEEKNRDRPLLREDGTKITDYDYYILGEGNERVGYNNTWLEYIDMALSLLNPTKYVGVLAKINVGSKLTTAAKLGNTTYETALAGGKHSGFLKNYLGRSDDEINKAIRSMQSGNQGISVHLDKIANPTKYVPNWTTLRSSHQQSLLNGWQNTVTKHSEQIQILNILLSK